MPAGMTNVICSDSERPKDLGTLRVVCVTIEARARARAHRRGCGCGHALGRRAWQGQDFNCTAVEGKDPRVHDVPQLQL